MSSERQMQNMSIIIDLEKEHGKLSHSASTDIIAMLESYTQRLNAIIIDNGTGMIKSGFYYDAEPQVQFPPIIGRPRHPGVMVGMMDKDYIGNDAYYK